MNRLIRELTAEAHEILVNIRAALLNGDITWQQRDELLALVVTDVTQKLTLARNLLRDWTGNEYGEYPTAG